MQINISQTLLQSDSTASKLIDLLRHESTNFEIDDAQIYYQFPVLKDLDESLLVAHLLIISKSIGLLAVGITSMTSHAGSINELKELDDDLDHVLTQLNARLLRNKLLGSARSGLAIPLDTFIYAPYLDTTTSSQVEGLQSSLLTTSIAIESYFNSKKEKSKADSRLPINFDKFEELIATLEGAKGLIRSEIRPVSSKNEHSKGNLANIIDSEIASFDERQKIAYMAMPDGLNRIRGLAGSGKTVILAMKAALTHLRYPDANIVYTFYTRSLYQHVRRLITRFYRQYDDRDPDWNRIQVLHAWGGQMAGGVYFNLCKQNGTQPYTFSEARRHNMDPFDFVCRNLSDNLRIPPIFDYCFIDEGQDFPASFFQLCIRATKNNSVTFAYDDLQTIFQAATPSLEQIIGSDSQGKPVAELKEDTVLYKCYRNPREILVCAHAMGFGIYGSKIVQMLETRDQWHDIGYEVMQGDFVAGSDTVIVRPDTNTLQIISKHQKADEIVQVSVYDSYSDEIQNVVENIESDIKDGLQPEDIVVIVVDDFNARRYLSDIEMHLEHLKIQCNNLHSDTIIIKDFHQKGAVTLTTVHKAKGNEGFMVYVVGIDHLFSTLPGVRERNLLFTAMTRAKGWLHMSGIGLFANACKEEILQAIGNFPLLSFKYPSAQQLKVIKRDLAQKDIKKYQSLRKLDEAMAELSQEEIENYVQHKYLKKEM